MAGGGGGGNTPWEWTTELVATRCLTISDETTVKKTSETDGDYHLCHGPDMTSGLYEWKIHVSSSCVIPEPLAVLYESAESPLS